MKVLLLAGTAEARQLSEALNTAGIETISSLAGATQRPAILPGVTRKGGFGGVEGLANFIVQNRITLLIDATHPFAAKMSKNAAQASEIAGISCAHLWRAAWPDKTGWRIVADLDQAAQKLRPGARVFLSTGRASLIFFQARKDVEFVARVIDELPDDFPLAKGKFLIGKPPFSIEEEVDTLRSEQIETLVTRNSGGTGGVEKLIAAERLGLEIIMIKQPDRENGLGFETVENLLNWLEAEHGRADH